MMRRMLCPRRPASSRLLIQSHPKDEHALHESCSNQSRIGSASLYPSEHLLHSSVDFVPIRIRFDCFALLCR
jgi:hypothetical protein